MGCGLQYDRDMPHPAAANTARASIGITEPERTRVREPGNQPYSGVSPFEREAANLECRFGPMSMTTGDEASRVPRSAWWKEHVAREHKRVTPGRGTSGGRTREMAP